MATYIETIIDRNGNGKPQVVVSADDNAPLTAVRDDGNYEAMVEDVLAGIRRFLTEDATAVKFRIVGQSATQEQVDHYEAIIAQLVAQQAAEQSDIMAVN